MSDFKEEDSNMNLINKVTEESYAQWIEKFVIDVLNKCNVECNEVIIEDIEFSKRVFLVVDGEEYDIRTWNFHPVSEDKNGKTCAEIVDYTLFKMVMDNNGNGHGEEVGEGRLNIEWKNEI